MFKSIIINILHSCSYVSILPLQQGPFSHCNKHRFMPNIQYYFTVPVYKGLVFYASDGGNGVHPVQQRYKEIRHFAQQVSLYIRKCEYVSEFIICSTSRLWSQLFASIFPLFHVLLSFIRGMVSCVYGVLSVFVCVGDGLNTVYLILKQDNQILISYKNACIYHVGVQIALYVREWFQRLLNVILLRGKQRGLAFVRVNLKRPYYLILCCEILNRSEKVEPLCFKEHY